ncbi:MAG: tetratricopeptide repeat protein [Acidiferrobacterales bacterium]
MRGYTTTDVAELLGMSTARIRSFARAGLLSAKRSPHGEYRFSFHDVVLLRTAQELASARIHPRKVWRALRVLKAKLPNGQPLTAVRIAAQGDHIVVRDKRTSWHPESGQVTFDFSVSDLADRAVPLVREAAEAAQRNEEATSDDWYNIGLDFEVVAAVDEAQEAYRRATELDPAHADAHVNLGRLLHAEGRVADAEFHYRQAVNVGPDNPTAQFNLGVALEDLGCQEDAINAYKQAITADPHFADAHYNLAHLYEQSGNKSGAIRHFARYKTLTSVPSPSP